MKCDKCGQQVPELTKGEEWVLNASCGGLLEEHCGGHWCPDCKRLRAKAYDRGQADVLDHYKMQAAHAGLLSKPEPAMTASEWWDDPSKPWRCEGHTASECENHKNISMQAVRTYIKLNKGKVIQ